MGATVEQYVRDFLADYFAAQARWRAGQAKRQRYGSTHRLAARGLELAARRVRRLPDSDRSLRRLVRLVEAAGGDAKQAVAFYERVTWREIPSDLSLWSRDDALSPRAFHDLLELIADASEAMAERQERV
jgi:hypothetical protein